MGLSHIQQIVNWFSKAIPSPTIQNRHMQVGVHLEEVGEMLSCFPRLRPVREAQDAVEDLQLRLKDYPEGASIDFNELNRIELLDSLCDQIVTAVGVAYMEGMDIIGALQEVVESNNSKFDSEGNPVFDSQLKITKGPNYFKPDLSKYV